MMKKLILLVAVVLTAGISQAQDVKASSVPDVVISKFANLYPGTKAEQWKNINGNYETKFTNGGSKMCVVINTSGNVVETATMIKESELPKPAIDYIAKTYVKKKATDTRRITESGGNVKYEAVVEDSRVYFDNNGAFVKSEKCKK